MSIKMSDEQIGVNHTTVFVEGELDIFTIETLIEKIDRLSVTRCNVNLDGVTFIDSSGIGLLIRKVMDWKEEGRILTISDMQPVVYEVMEEMGAFIILEEVYSQ
ncbi:STAS domain-containing protein [Cytobacillus firmus]|uniref:Anti-anti-sigma factor n=1 Tax=Cytobacillus firmus DS1 TaxID=1307436 RepID=W7KVS6_CYTFI|nr:STAS domain-containing protein [Cytobacillus firmus]EWG11560.1 anti-anti-sigma factor [Cytobacillus firmus DS1]